jgi:regulation of enolase protein 1 (concanavalin A-like superfamily)
VTARVATIQNVHAWTKAGVMIRQTLDPGSAHATMLVSAGKGLAFQRRVAAGGVSTNTSLAGTAPRWVRVVRTGRTVTASASADGQSWTTVGQDTVALTGAVWVGMAVSSHDSSQLATATFDQVSVADTPVLPSGWNAADVGGVGVAGSSSGVNATFTVSGSGADIWGTADAFHYAYRTLSGDGQLVARVAAIQNTNRWAKAGVMVRQTLAANSTYALMLVSAGAGTALQYRAGTGAPAVSVAGSTGSAPRWVKVVRAGDMLSGFESVDGTTWTPVGSVAIAMGATVRIGLAVSSHDNAQLCQATFERVAP